MPVAPAASPFAATQPVRRPGTAADLARATKNPTLEQTSAPCSVCDGPIDPARFRQVWISLRVATDVLPLLVNACSTACVEALPEPADGYVANPHQGGPAVQQPEPRW
ncbi:hypothetical protein [Phytohabitans aurantiacus]|uniref:4Fe-4S Wbl-type domain-containing protein n=1 Tax=Phytohabitans aurantiacus TaxID=3016789 RepID=A0ABQ5QN85_9ACTN|nr:hypothetical protein [Phytohabitans aurantiacus]GLH95422.1 hypothetical protein Pa4123_06940 [Phytohabitans aurantiacus]